MMAMAEAPPPRRLRPSGTRVVRGCVTRVVSLPLLLVGCVCLIYCSMTRGGGKLTKRGVGEGDASLSEKAKVLESLFRHEGLVGRDPAAEGTEARALLDAGLPVVVQDRTLCPSGNASTVLALSLQEPFDIIQNGTTSCTSVIWKIVVRDDSPVFYYMLHESCWDSQLRNATKERMSIRKAEMGRVPSTGDGGLISYWWAQGNGTGEAELSPRVIDPRITPDMARPWSMDLSPSGSHLVLAPNSRSPALKSQLVFLDVATGRRQGSDSDWDVLNSVGFNPNKTYLFVSEISTPPRILSAAMGAGIEGMPMNALPTLETVREVPKSVRPDITSVEFGGQSFDPKDRCLYIANHDNETVWSLNLSNPKAKLTHVAGSGEIGETDGDASNCSFDGLCVAVATPDGCNLFVLQRSGLLRWIKLEAPCGKAVNVSTVATYTGPKWRALALHYVGGNASLLLGTRDGKVFRMEINSSALHACTADKAEPPPFFPSSPTGSPSPASVSASSLIPSPSSVSAYSASDSGLPLGVIVIVGSVLGGCLVVALLLAGIYWITRRRRRPSAHHDDPSALSGLGTTTSSTLNYSRVPAVPSVHADQRLCPPSVQAFPFAQLAHCTMNFDARYRIGEKGAFGEVYWAEVGSREVAIKVMMGEVTAVKRQQFLAEVNTLSRLHHGNLVELIGYCQEGNRSILVYPFFSGGSLHDRLHKRQKAGEQNERVPALLLRERVSIACQIANGLSYLHHGADPPVIHRDIKSHNVLLSDGRGDSLRAVLADFGLATIGHSVFDSTHESIVRTCHVAGTQGYMAPEYLRMGRLTAKVDVYSFGVIILELLTARKSLLGRYRADGHAL
ncbi:hypothetical protein CBR_g3807 [Chara braunii]|uniref:Protein kinase domain-containing protein n=1 Tax=Chara braunii TaxID=69332 RepID=A0A388KGE9_CHABU|nr:hypothetical protein CBR_g3807 [Chara braunii]|eukprot:GBG69109.1 hypothetical protein CBR_g3807 [Chara braunii]